MTANDDPTGVPKKPRREGRKPSSPASEAAPHLDLSTITIHAKTGQILRIESVDDRGAPHELSDDEKACLLKETGNASLQAVIEQAFEAGIACMLGDRPVEDDSPESEEDVDLRRFLLLPLIQDSAPKHLMQPDVWSKAIVGTLISNAIHSRAPDREGGPGRHRAGGPTSKSRQRTQSP